MILKLISFIFILYLVYRLFSFFFRGLFMIMGKRVFERAQKQHYRQRDQQYRAPDGSVRIEHVPPKDNNKKQQADFRGGEYVDYEEIKKK
jgi:hypothetical protein